MTYTDRMGIDLAKRSVDKSGMCRSGESLAIFLQCAFETLSSVPVAEFDLDKLTTPNSVLICFSLTGFGTAL